MDKVRAHLVETGEYETLVKRAKQELTKSGWYDQVNAIAIQESSTSEDPSFEVIAAKIEEQALRMVPENIKVDLLRRVHDAVQSI